MIGSLELGGSQSMVMNIYRNIDREKVQFDFIVDHPDRMYFADEIAKLGGKIFIMPTFIGRNVLEIRRKWNDFFQNHKEYKILHSHVRSYASLYLPIAKKYGVKTIIHSHSTSNGKGILAIVKKIMQYPLRYQADYYMACSYEAGRWLFGKNVTKRGNFFVIKNAIDAKKFSFDDEMRKSSRNNLGITDEFIVGYLGRVITAKNPKFVVEVFRELLNRQQKSKLLFVGDGELLSEIVSLVESYKISDKVIFTGSRNDTERMYAAMDVYCFPSLWEGLGISLIEAQASGLPCVCSENVPMEAYVTRLVHQLSLSENYSVWVDKILSLQNEKRKDTYEEIKESGYDIQASTTRIYNFYCTIWEKIWARQAE